MALGSLECIAARSSTAIDNSLPRLVCLLEMPALVRCSSSCGNSHELHACTVHAQATGRHAQPLTTLSEALPHHLTMCIETGVQPTPNTGCMHAPPPPLPHTGCLPACVYQAASAW